MESYEKSIDSKIDNREGLPEKLDISMIRYFWQASPLSGSRKDTIPKFLRNIAVLKNFSDNELRLLSKFLHLRTFRNGEHIFQQGDLGIGFYFIFSGHVDVVVEDVNKDEVEDKKEDSKIVLSLERFDYFGELALLQEHSIRNASVVARESCMLLGIFKPDVEELISYQPVVAAKLLQSVSLIVANRLHSLTNKTRQIKYKLSQLEKEKEEWELNKKPKSGEAK